MACGRPIAFSRILEATVYSEAPKKATWRPHVRFCYTPENTSQQEIHEKWVGPLVAWAVTDMMHAA